MQIGVINRQKQYYTILQEKFALGKSIDTFKKILFSQFGIVLIIVFFILYDLATVIPLG